MGGFVIDMVLPVFYIEPIPVDVLVMERSGISQCPAKSSGS